MASSSKDKPSRTVRNSARLAWQKGPTAANKPTAKTPDTPRTTTETSNKTPFTEITKGKKTIPKIDSTVTSPKDAYDPKSINNITLEKHEETRIILKSPKEAKLIKKKQEKADRKRIKKDKKAKKKKEEEKSHSTKKGIITTGWNAIDNEGAIEGGKDDMTISKTVEPSKKSKSKGSASKIDKESTAIGSAPSNPSKPLKKKKRLNPESNIKPNSSNSSQEETSNDAIAAAQSAQPQSSPKTTPSKKGSKPPVQTTTLLNYFTSPSTSASKATTPQEKKQALTEIQMKEAYNILNTQETNFGIGKIYDLEEQDESFTLKRHHLQEYTPFQQAQILSSLLFNMAASYEKDLCQNSFIGYCHNQCIDNLIRCYNIENLLKRLISEVKSSNVKQLTPKDFAPAYYEDIIGQKILTDIQDHPDTVGYKLQAIKKVIERFYSYRVDALQYSIEKCSAEDIHALYYEPGTIQDLIKEKGIVIQWCTPDYVPCQPHLHPAAPNDSPLYEPDKTIKLGQQRFEEEKTKEALKGLLTKLVLQTDPDYSTKVNNTLRAFSADKLRSYITVPGLFQDLVSMVKNHFPTKASQSKIPTRPSSQPSTNLIPSVLNPYSNKIPSTSPTNQNIIAPPTQPTSHPSQNNQTQPPYEILNPFNPSLTPYTNFPYQHLPHPNISMDNPDTTTTVTKSFKQSSSNKRLPMDLNSYLRRTFLKSS